MKRVVTGHSADGKSIFVSEGEPPDIITLEHVPGVEMRELWATGLDPRVPCAPGEPTSGRASLVPGPGETCFRLFVTPPMAAIAQAMGDGADLDAVQEEMARKMPGLAEALEMDNPGMHATDTVDYIVVISGEMSLELDDGQTVELKPGDSVVQNGTRHAWRNFGTEPCVAVAVMIGATRTGGTGHA